MSVCISKLNPKMLSSSCPVTYENLVAVTGLTIKIWVELDCMIHWYFKQEIEKSKYVLNLLCYKCYFSSALTCGATGQGPSRWNSNKAWFTYSSNPENVSTHRHANNNLITRMRINIRVYFIAANFHFLGKKKQAHLYNFIITSS